MGRETEDDRADERAERRRRAGRRLRGWRDGARIHQRDMAARLGVAQQTYSQYERGLVQIPYGLAERVAELFGMEEVEVWRGLCLPLPKELRDPDVPASRNENPERRPPSTLDAIMSDPDLDEETRQHFANQYKILKGLTEFRRQAESPGADLPPEEQILAVVDPDVDEAKDKVRSGSRRRR